MAATKGMLLLMKGKPQTSMKVATPAFRCRSTIAQGDFLVKLGELQERLLYSCGLGIMRFILKTK